MHRVAELLLKRMGAMIEQLDRRSFLASLASGAALGFLISPGCAPTQTEAVSGRVASVQEDYLIPPGPSGIPAIPSCILEFSEYPGQKFQVQRYELGESLPKVGQSLCLQRRLGGWREDGWHLASATAE